MKLLFLTDNFPPEVNAPATRTFEHCREWVKQGIDVTVITCAPNFPKGKVFKGYRNKLLQKETIAGIKVIRVWTYMTENKGVFKRIIDYYSFAFSAFFVGLFIKTDIIIATSPQFFTAIAGRMLGFWKRTPWIMEVRDLWPESIKNVEAVNDGFLIRFLEREELKCYRQAKGIVTVTEGVRNGVISKIQDKEKVIVITNGANIDLFEPKEPSNELVEKYNLQDKFIISYIGTHGMAHKLDFIVKTADKLHVENVHFLFIGDGAEKKELESMAKNLKLENVTFVDTIPKEKVVDFYSISDLSLINLKSSKLFLGAIPSKIFESAAMEKPILLGVDGEAREIVEKYGAGLYFEPENEADLIEKINLFLNKKVNLEKMKLGCRQLAIDFDRKKLAKEMLDFVQVQVDSVQKKKS
ncbi:MAG TPA: glycosyltransferase family 4 protein [Bacteroidales bacterium]